MAKEQSISLSNILVNTENYRFEPIGGQKDAIDTMIDDQKEKLFNLASHILQHGLNPNDKIQVVPSSNDPSKYNVLEGNRRTVSLKLLLNPDLIEGQKHALLKKKFKKLHDDNKGKLIKAINCVVYDDPKEADVWIGIKHGYGQSGTGTDGWTPLQKDRYQEKTEGKSSITIQIINLLKKSPDVPSEIKSSVEKLDTSNVTRLIGDPDVRDMLGIEINNGIIQSNIEQQEVIKGLTQIAQDLLHPKFTVKKIYYKEDRKKYIDKFPKKFTPDHSKKVDKPWQFTPTVTPPTAPPPKPKPQPKERKTLIPKSCAIRISNPKLNSIYHELQNVDIKHKHACAVLYRVFIELSVDTYIEEHKLAGTPSAAKSGMNFQQKVNVVANHMENKKWADAAICKGIKNAIKENNSILGIDTWHAYVHNNKFSPEAHHLTTTWDNIQEFVVILWNNIK